MFRLPMRRSALLLAGLPLATALITTLALSACSPETSDFFIRSFVPMNFDKTAMLAESLDSVVLPGYQGFESSSKSLATALDRLAASPEAASLEAARSAWRLAAYAWDATEAYQFGPADEERIRQQIHFWPRRPDHIQSVLTATTPLSLSSYGTTRRGLPVIEYVLFGPPAQTITSPAGERARGYAALLGKDLITQAQLLTTYWSDAGKRASLSQDTAQLNRNLNQWVMLLEDNKNKRLGLGLGMDQGLAGSKTDPTATEAPDSKASLYLLRGTLEGFAKAYRGRQTGIDAYLVALGHRKLDTQIQAGITGLETRFQSFETRGGLEQTLREDPAAVRAAYDDMTNLLRLVKVDLANALNETVHFTDNDGD